LVKAYGLAAKECIQSAKIEEYVKKVSCSFSCEYHLSGKIEYLLKSLSNSNFSMSYDERVRFEVTSTEAQIKDLETSLQEISAGSISIDY
jgi:putative IMPACT (imprinted ancient) family translation regulator